MQRSYFVIMVALCNRADHYILALRFISIYLLFSSSNISGRRLDVYHTSPHGVRSLSAACEFRMHV